MEKQINKLRFIIYLLSIVLVLQVIGSAFFYRNSNLLFSTSQKNINSLINEVGQLKDENRILDEEVDYQKQITTLNESALTDIFQQIDDKLKNDEELKQGLENYKTTLENEKKRLQKENQNLNNLLNLKISEIENNKTQKELNGDQDLLNNKILAILLLGENQKLTDSIIVLTINPDNSKNTLISIPRDLYINGRKINEYYELYGIDRMKEVIQEVTGIRADHYVKFNFDALTDFVDYLGGVNVQIDEKLKDISYPTSGHGYQTVTFDPGIENMDGERALQFARSRKSTSDFDRSLRQQKIILAIKNKLDLVNALEKPDFYIKSFSLIMENTVTDLDVFSAIQIYNSHKNSSISAGNILSNENFLYSSKSITGQSILLPKGDDFLAFQQKILEII